MLPYYENHFDHVVVATLGVESGRWGLQKFLDHTLRTSHLDGKPRKIKTVAICSMWVTFYMRLLVPRVAETAHE